MTVVEGEEQKSQFANCYTCAVEITIEGPVLSNGIGNPIFGIDDIQAQSFDAQPMLPESLVRGNVVHVLREMADAVDDASVARQLNDVRGWFGRGSDKLVDGDSEGHRIDTNKPDRRRILFGDFRLEVGKQGRRITRIALDDDTGSVKHGSLQVLESPLDYGEQGTFKGTVTLFLSKENAEIASAWIARALQCVPAFGAMKGSGFGRMVDVNVGAVAAVEKPEPNTTPIDFPRADDKHVAFALKIDRPFLVNAQSISANQFKGSIDIPGAVIKGAVADMLEYAGKLDTAVSKALDTLVFRHAKPAKAADAGLRPRAIPLSLYDSDGVLRDALVDCPLAAGKQQRYVEFSVDWKPDSNVQRCALFRYGHTFDFVYDIRTRTKISETGTAEDEKLFTHMAVVPQDHIWIGEIERPDGVDDDAFEAIMHAMADGIRGLGKTRANAEVWWLQSAGPRSAEPIRSEDGKTTWRVVLETDALLHGPGEERTALADHYRNYFAKALGTAPKEIELRFYAHQRWVGRYQARRFPLYVDRYAPQLITEAGSVFELTGRPGIDAKYESLARFGLPLPDGIGVGKAMQFERSAFNPENGYGEVTIEARDLTKPVTEA